MYTTYFGLQAYPFNLSSDLRFFYMGPVYREAYISILSAIRERQGLILLTGEPGTGKTMLLHRIASSLKDTIHVVSLPSTPLTFEELVTYLCDQLALQVGAEDLLTRVRAIKEHLAAWAQRGGTEVLFIDEAQNLDKHTLARLRLLLSLEGPAGKLLQIVLAGTSELETTIAQPELYHVQQHVAAWCRLRCLPEEEVGLFIQHRLRTVGCERPDLFAREALLAVAHYSQAVPRFINVICDNALLAAYTVGQQTVSATIIEEVARNLLLKKELKVSKEKAPNPQPPARQAGEQKKSPSSLQRSSRQVILAGIGILFVWFSFAGQKPGSWLMEILPQKTSRTPVEAASFLEGTTTEPEAEPLDHQTGQSQKKPLRLAAPTEPTPSLAIPQTPQNQSVQQRAVHPPVQQGLSPQGAPQVLTSDASVLALEFARQKEQEQELPSKQSAASEQRWQQETARAELAQIGIPVSARALLDSVEEGNAHLAELLLTAGTSANAKDQEDWTPLMLAVHHNQLYIVYTLIAYGADVNTRNKAGETALIMAARNDLPVIVEALLDKGALINAANKQGWTALMYAAWKGHRATVETLLNRGADVQLANKSGWTALMYATRQGKKMDQSLLDQEAAVPVSDNKDYQAIAKLLQQAGAKR